MGIAIDGAGDGDGADAGIDGAGNASGVSGSYRISALL